jgi:hypothetical protein
MGMMFHEKSRTIIYEERDNVPSSLIYATRSPYVFVRATYSNLVALTALGLPVPDPMVKYDWPISPGKEPWATQKEVSKFLVLNPRSFDFSDTRAGKTAASLWAADWLMSRAKVPMSAVIFSNILPLTDAWAYTITTNLLGRRTYRYLHHPQAERRELELAKPADFYLLNPDGLRIGYNRDQSKRKKLFAAISARTDIKIIIFDEADTYIHHNTDLWRAATAFSRHKPFVWLLTATPTPNGPVDAYALKKLCHPDTQLAYRQWRDKTTETKPWSPFKLIARPEAAAHVDALLRPSVRVPRRLCFDETEFRGRYEHVAMSDQQKAYMRELQNQLLLMLSNGTQIDAVNQAALRLKLIQIACGAVYDGDHLSHLIDAAPRIAAYKQLIKEAEGKVITFVPLVNVAQMLSHVTPNSILIPSGGTQKKKLEVLTTFQQSDIKNLISHPSPIARGTDITAANTIVWYAPTDRTSHFLHGNDRINGINQTEIRNIIRMSGCSIEEDIYEKTDHNKSLMGTILALKDMKF